MSSSIHNKPKETFGELLTSSSRYQSPSNPPFSERHSYMLAKDRSPAHAKHIGVHSHHEADNAFGGLGPSSESLRERAYPNMKVATLKTDSKTQIRHESEARMHFNRHHLDLMKDSTRAYIPSQYISRDITRDRSPYQNPVYLDMRERSHENPPTRSMSPKLLSPEHRTQQNILRTVEPKIEKSYTTLEKSNLLLGRPERDLLHPFQNNSSNLHPPFGMPQVDPNSLSYGNPSSRYLPSSNQR